MTSTRATSGSDWRKWLGRPFELPRASEPEPRSGLLPAKRSHLEQVRRGLLRQCARTLARQLGRGRGFGQPPERLERLTAGLPGEDLPWFLRFLAVLHEEGPGSARQCLSLWAEVVDPPQQPRLRQQATCLLQVVDAERPRPPPELPDLDPTPGGIPLVGRRKELEELRRFAE